MKSKITFNGVKIRCQDGLYYFYRRQHVVGTESTDTSTAEVNKKISLDDAIDVQEQMIEDQDWYKCAWDSSTFSSKDGVGSIGSMTVASEKAVQAMQEAYDTMSMYAREAKKGCQGIEFFT